MHSYILQAFQSEVVVGTEVTNNPYHIVLIKNELTRNIQVILPDLVDELSLAVPEYMPTKGSGTLCVLAIRRW